MCVCVCVCVCIKMTVIIRVKKTNLMHNLFPVHFVRTLHVLGVATVHHQEAHRKPTTISTNCCRLAVCLLMMGCGYARNM